jgi:hypothetical protein
MHLFLEGLVDLAAPVTVVPAAHLMVVRDLLLADLVTADLMMVDLVGVTTVVVSAASGVLV